MEQPSMKKPPADPNVAHGTPPVKLARIRCTGSSGVPVASLAMDPFCAAAKEAKEEPIHAPGFTMIPNAALVKMAKRGVSASAERLYSRLCMISRGKRATCVASIARLIAVTGMNRRTLQRARAELVEAGLIVKESGGAGHSAVKYRLPDRSTMVQGQKRGDIFDTPVGERGVKYVTLSRQERKDVSGPTTEAVARADELTVDMRRLQERIEADTEALQNMGTARELVLLDRPEAG